MNLKHEMFWNIYRDTYTEVTKDMNLKHEMFWNYRSAARSFINNQWDKKI